MVRFSDYYFNNPHEATIIKCHGIERVMFVLNIPNPYLGLALPPICHGVM